VVQSIWKVNSSFMTTLFGCHPGSFATRKYSTT